MNTILAGRTVAQEFVHDLGRWLRAVFGMITRPDASDDEASTRFSWPRGL